MTNPPILIQYANNRDKRKHSHLRFLSLVCQATHQGPGVSVGNLSLRVNGKCAVCRKGRFADTTLYLAESEVDAPFTGKWTRLNGFCGPFIAGCKLGQWVATGVGCQKNMLIC